jgi:hypothetical protein
MYNSDYVKLILGNITTSLNNRKIVKEEIYFIKTNIHVSSFLYCIFA